MNATRDATTLNAHAPLGTSTSPEAVSVGTLRPDTPIKIAILAMGGQGGGVLADWIVEMAEHAGWWAQSTSVPGVAQRTGATIYYLELLPEAAIRAAGRPPVLAMMPTPGDVDLVVAAELMEAGRAMQRGLVTPERTTLISSSHRSFAIAEKSAPGNGIADPDKVIDAGREAARRMLCFDLQAIADGAGSVISASLFGAIAGAAVLPFPREAFEQTIRAAGKGVEASLRAFAHGFDAAAAAPATPAAIGVVRTSPTLPDKATNPNNPADPAVQALLNQLRSAFPASAQPMLVAGLRRLIDYQDVDYAAQYLRQMVALHALDARHGGEAQAWALTEATARQLAVAMAYDDVVRVADLKTRGSRFARVRGEVGATPGQIIHTTEYMHPRLEEISATLPAGAGRWLMRSRRIGPLLRRWVERGRRIRSDSLYGFLMLYAVAGLRRFRRASLRYEGEMASIEAWLARVRALITRDYALAVELVHCRRLIKGYSDTHARGDSKFSILMDAAEQLAGRSEAAVSLRRLREAALAEESCDALKQRLAETVDTSLSSR